jgi:hypothetical protein
MKEIGIRLVHSGKTEQIAMQLAFGTERQYSGERAGVVVIN